MKAKNKKVISAAILGLLSVGVVPLAHAADAAKGECHGVNACKGKGECGGKGNSCAGKNACKGQGWVTKTEAECKELKGEFHASSAHTEKKK